MRSSLLLVLSLFAFIGFSQDKKGTIRVEKSTIAGLYKYESKSETKTYIRIFKDSSVMLANNREESEYMMYWFDRMARDSNLPKGKLEFFGEEVRIEIKIAQSKEDNILLRGTFIEPTKMKLHRVGKDVDNKDYIFIKQ